MAAYTTIDDPSAYFKVQLYTGNGSANHAITFNDTDTDMQPDFVWIKNRDATDANCLFDSVRGATKVVHSGTTDIEATDADTLDSFTSDGFQVDADVKVNTSSEKYVAWCWKAGTTSGITTTNSTITPAGYSFNATSGFSIVQYDGNSTSGAKVPHGLNGIPDFVAIRNLDASEAWICGHDILSGTWTRYIRFDTDAAEHASSVTARQWNNTAPTQYNVVLGDDGSVNTATTRGYAMYSWKSIQGFSSISSYIGNGNADGPFVYTGFRVAYLMIKRVDAVKSWYIVDNKRNLYNGSTGLFLVVDKNDIEYSGAHLDIDFLSNGFKCRNADVAQNASGSNYIYMAFAEAPLVNSNGVPCNAR